MNPESGKCTCNNSFLKCIVHMKRRKSPTERPEPIGLRDYFAAHAPIVHGEAVERGTTESDMIKWLAKLAFEYADAMMEERKKK